MSQNAALFRILFENDTLFQVAGAHTAPVSESVSSSIATAPATSTTAAPEPVETPVVQTVVSEPAPPTTIPLPALKYPVLILTDEPDHQNLKESEATLLDNILKAVGHSAAEADILNVSFLQSNDARSVFSGKRVNYFITFGVPLAKLHLDMLLVPYTPKDIQGITFLLADPLAVIEADKALKKRLWLALQKMFEKN